MERDRRISVQAAYFRMEKLDEFQAAGIIVHDLSRAQVTVPHFGKHALDGMDYILKNSWFTSVK